MDEEFPIHRPIPDEDPISSLQNPGAEHDIAASMSLREKISRIWRAAREDYSETDTSGKRIIGGYIAMIGYELFIGNEVITPLVGGQTLDTASGLGRVAISVATSVAVTSIPVYLQQRAGGILSRRTAQQFPSVSKESYNDLDEGESSSFKSFHDLSAGKRAYYSFVLGSTFNVTREAVVTGQTSDEVLKPVEKASARTTAAMVAILAACANIANQRFEDNDVVQWVIDNGVKNPLVWLGIGVGLIAKDSLAAKKNRNKSIVNETQTSEDTKDQQE